MSARKPVSAAQILELLEQKFPTRNRYAIPVRDVVSAMRQEFHTTNRKAGEWLYAATKEEPHGFELIGTVAGRVRYVWRDSKDLLLDAAGYAGTPNVENWPQLTSQGVPVSRDPDAAEGEFVVFSNSLRVMCKQSEEFSERARAVQRRLSESEIAEAEELYGSSIAHIRGLLKAAGVDLEELRARHHKSTTVLAEHTTVKITLTDKDIDAVAEVLSAFGIEPDPPTQIITRKPLQEATE